MIGQNQRQIKNRLSEAVAASGPGRWSSSNAQRRKRGEERPVDGGHCRIWVNLVVLSVRRSFPVYPKKKQTFSVSVGMSQRCHKRTQGLQHDRQNERPLRGGLSETQSGLRWGNRRTVPIIET